MKNTIFIFLFLLTSFVTNAQKGRIIYTDFEPDMMQYVTLDNTWFIDINYDNISDLKITGYIDPNWHFFMPLVYMLNGFEYCVSNPDTYLDSDTLTWKTYDDWYANHTLTGTVPYDGNGYCSYGFRTLKGNDYYYGWMSLWVNLNNPNLQYMQHGRDIYIDKMAFCTIPNYPLRYGQLSFLIDVDGIEDPLIYPNPIKDVFTVADAGIETISVVNLLGQCIITKECNNGAATIDLSGQPAGIYIMRMRLSDGMEYSQRIIKE